MEEGSISYPDARLHLQLSAWRGTPELRGYTAHARRVWPLYGSLLTAAALAPVAPEVERSGLLAEARERPWAEVEARLNLWRDVLWRTVHARSSSSRAAAEAAAAAH